jgi:hypothetical protein
MNVMYVVYVMHLDLRLKRGLLMPNRKKTEIVRRIHAAGYLREIDTALHLDLPTLTIKMDPSQSFVFDYCGGMGVILELRIASNQLMRIQDFGDLELLERKCNIEWWMNEEHNVYRFNHGPEYPRGRVLNHRIGKCGKVEPGDPLEGVLLGWSTTSIPSQYSHGFRLPLMLSILDGFDNPHTAQLFVPVDEHLCGKIRRPSQSALHGPSSHSAPGWNSNGPGVTPPPQQPAAASSQEESDMLQCLQELQPGDCHEINPFDGHQHAPASGERKAS